MKILITTNTIPDKTGAYIVLKNIIPYLMENNEVTILTNSSFFGWSVCMLSVLCLSFIDMPQESISG